MCIVAKKLLYNPYYFTKDGKKDMFYEICYDCSIINSYNIAKNVINEPGKLVYSAINDLTMCIECSREDKVDYLFGNDCGIPDSNIIVKEYVEKDEGAIPLLHKLLDEGNMVLISTVHEYLPFCSMYNPDFSLDNLDREEKRHVFTILDYDENHYYYLEDPFAIINYEHFQSFEGKKDIGIYDRKQMEKIFSLYLRCFTVNFTQNFEEVRNKRFKAAVASSIKNYELNVELTDKNTYIYRGRNALKKLRELSAGKGILYQDTVKKMNLTWNSTIDWNCSLVFKKRRIMWIALEEMRKKNLITVPSNKVFDLLKRSEKQWVKCRNIVDKDRIRKKLCFDFRFYSLLAEIIEIEDMLIEEMKNIKF